MIKIYNDIKIILNKKYNFVDKRDEKNGLG